MRINSSQTFIIFPVYLTPVCVRSAVTMKPDKQVFLTGYFMGFLAQAHHCLDVKNTFVAF